MPTRKPASAPKRRNNSGPMARLQTAMRSLVRSGSPLVSRADLSARLGKQFGSARDLYAVLGYLTQPSVEHYLARYLRQDIAGTIVDAPPDATWRNPPRVCEDKDSSTETAFEKAWSELAKRLKVWHYFNRIDRIAGIGSYGVLLIGVRNHTGGNFE